MNVPDYNTAYWTMWFMTGCHIDGLVPPNVVTVRTDPLDVLSKLQIRTRPRVYYGPMSEAGPDLRGSPDPGAKRCNGRRAGREVVISKPRSPKSIGRAFGTRMTAGEFAKAAEARHRPEERWPTDAEFHAMEGLRFLQFRLGEYEGWDRQSPSYYRDEGAIAGIVADRKEQREKASEKARRIAAKPRPGRQHSRKAEALAMALDLHDRRPDLSISAVGTHVASRMPGDDVPSGHTIRDWLTQALRKKP